MRTRRNSARRPATRPASGRIPRWRLLVLLTLLIATNLPLRYFSVFAASGLDPTFGGGGWVVVEERSTEVAIQPDGRIVVAGTLNDSTGGDFAVWRYNADGSPDFTFGMEGKVRTDFFGSYDEAAAVLIQPDGKIVVAGYVSTPSGTDCGLARYNTDGTLDTTFSSDGKATADFLGNYDLCSAVALQPDGKILVAGYAQTASLYYDFALARFNADGSPDTSFSEDGQVTTDFLGSNDLGSAVGVDAVSGKIVVAGSAYTPSFSARMALARYNADGSLDTTFSGDGKVIAAFFGINDVGSAVAVQPADGRIIVGGYTSDAAGQVDFALVRYNTDGSLDTTFSGDGKVTTDILGSYDVLSAIRIQPDGQIVAGGSAFTPNNVNAIALARYAADGSLDATFGTGGEVTAGFYGFETTSSGLDIQDDGKLVVVGSTSYFNSTASVLARFDTSGAGGGAGPDTIPPATPSIPDMHAASDTGISATDNITEDSTPTFVGPAEPLSLVLLQVDGSLAGAALADAAGAWTFTVGQPLSTGIHWIAAAARDAAGNESSFSATLIFAITAAATGASSEAELDPSLGTAGVVLTDGSTGVASKIALQTDGKIVSAGFAPSDAESGSVFAVWRHNFDGSRDLPFGSGGRVTTSFGSSTSSSASDVAVQPDGKIVAVGTVENFIDNNPSDFGLVRYNTDGSLDTTFGVGGRVTTDFQGNGGEPQLQSYADRAAAVVLQPDGKIVVAGTTVFKEFYYSDPVYDFAVARYNPDGTLDATFGNGGMVITDVGTQFEEEQAYAALIQPDGKIVVVGSTDRSGDSVGRDFGLVRYNPDGTLDATFGSGGIITTDFGSYYDVASSVALQTDGRIVAAGAAFDQDRGNLQFALARYNIDGTLDEDFGNNGLATTDFFGASDQIWGVAIRPDGRIVAVGQATQGDEGGSIDFALASYNPDGNLDTTFGDEGRTTTDFAHRNDVATDVALQDDGKIVVVGRTECRPGGGGEGQVACGGLQLTWVLARYGSGGEGGGPAAPSTPDLEPASDSGASQDDNITANATPTFVGTAEPNIQVELLVDDAVVAITTTDDTGAWSVTSGALFDGAHSVTARSRDEEGNVSPSSGALIVIIDTSAPAAPSTPDLDASSDSGTSAFDDVTSDSTPTFTGTAEPGSQVELLIDDVLVGTTTASATGEWTFTTGALDQIAHAVTARSRDEAGNVSAPSAMLVVIVDTSAPAAPSAPDLETASDTGGSASDNVTNDTTPTVTGTAEANATVNVFVDGVSAGITTANSAGEWSLTMGALGDGTHTIAAQARDDAGNESGLSSELLITIDTQGPTVAPTVPDLDAASDTGASTTDNITNDTTPSFTGTADAGATVTLFVDGTAAGSTTADDAGVWHVTTGVLGEGAHAVTAQAADAAGNGSPVSAPLAVTIDTQGPTVAPSTPDLDAASDTGASATDNLTADTTPTFVGTAEPGIRVVLLVDGAPAGSTTADGSGAWSATTGVLGEGAHMVTARAEDAAGNPSPESGALAITIDASAPAPPSAPDLAAASDTGGSATDNTTADTTPTFVGTAAPGDDILLFVDGASAGTTTADGTGSWSLTTGVLGEGAHTVTARARDAAGNLSTPSTGLLLTIDTSFPGGSNSPPVCSVATAVPNLLWPPNRQFSPITIGGVTDADGNVVTITITRILQDEPTIPPGHFVNDGCGSHHHDLGDDDEDGDDDHRGWGRGRSPGWSWNNWSGHENISIDGLGVGTSQAQVRAERLGYGGGRLYEIRFTADDGNGGTCTGVVTVGVPRDQNSTVVDSNTRYDSTVAGGSPLSGPAFNRPPKYLTPGDQRSDVNKAVTLATLATDPNGDTLRYSDVVTGGHSLPPGLSLNAGTGKITGTPTRVGTYIVTLTASDPYGGSTTATFTWTIVALPRHHHDGDGCDHDRRRRGHYSGDGCEHDRLHDSWRR